MKKLSALLIIPFLLLPGEALAGRQDPGGAQGRACYKEVWREEYVPGNRNRRGYVRRWKETKRIRCNRNGGRVRRNRSYYHYTSNNNSCVNGAIIGGLIGGGSGAALSRDEGRYWAIPLGIITGSAIGCHIDSN